MTTDEAYDHTMQVIDQLKASGIEVRTEPSTNKKPEMLEKYSGPERVHSDKWIHVHFFPKDDNDERAIYESARNLAFQGIHFDTGGTYMQRDWECDWSFKYTGEREPVTEVGRETVETILQDLKKEDKNEQGGAAG